MDYRITGLPADQFIELQRATDDELQRRGDERRIVDEPLLSVRAYDEKDCLVDAEVAPGTELETLIGRFFAAPQAAYLHVHNARPGCYACRVDRV